MHLQLVQCFCISQLSSKILFKTNPNEIACAPLQKQTTKQDLPKQHKTRQHALHLTPFFWCIHRFVFPWNSWGIPFHWKHKIRSFAAQGFLCQRVSYSLCCICSLLTLSGCSTSHPFLHWGGSVIPLWMQMNADEYKEFNQNQMVCLHCQRLFNA